MRHIAHYTSLIILFLSSFIVHSSSLLHAQPRDAGQMVVPRGWESEDSLRWGIFSVQGALSTAPEADSLLNDLEVTFDPEWGGIAPNTPFSAKRKGILAYGHHNSGDRYDWSNLGMILMQRIYYPSPARIPLGEFDEGYFWRYNDIHFNPQVKYFNNTYDSNDISAYAEYPRNDSISALTFWTYRNTVSPDTTGEEVSNSNEGRVILGYWDNRNAEQLLRTSSRYDSLPGNPKDTAETFSVTLEFNVDTDSINTSGWAGIDTTPLIRLQVLYKKGNEGGLNVGWSVLPFVPFRDAANPTNLGWYKLIDTIITKKIYDSLPYSWRRPDKTESGSPARLWNFKQLHVMIDEKPQSLSDRIILTDNPDVRNEYGGGSSALSVTTSQHQDSLVKVDSTGLTNESFLLESRVLSTYRATVRVRSLTWQDTVMDKYLYRKPEGDSSWSCNPDGSRGGYDALVNYYLDRWSNDLGTNKPREILFNDNHEPFGPLSVLGIAYIDFMASKFNIHARIREQEHGGKLSTQFRRERLSYDGKPPSIFENQYNKFGSNTFMVSLGLGLHDYFPSDYLISGRSLDLTQSWPSSQDSMVGLILSRIDASIGGDSLKPYRLYTQYISGLDPYTSSMRKSAYVALRHPKDRRFAIESDIQGWGLMHGAGTANPVYHQRPTTPEETISMFYAGLANGVSAFNSAQGIDLSPIAAQPGAIGPLYRNNPTDPVHLGADFNFGHHRRNGSWNTSTETCETDGVSYPYYLGYANQYRAYKRAISRINQVYDTNSYNRKYPFKRLEWLDAYSSYKSLSTSYDKSDTSQYNESFLKAFCTTPVKRWSRGSKNEYIDSTMSSSLVPDSAHRTYVEVGLFRDNPNDTLKGYAAMVVNTRLWPSLRDAEDSIYYNQGLDSAKDRSRSTLGDIDTRKVWFKIDTSNFPPEFQTQYYLVRDVWHQDTTYLIKHDSDFAIYLKPGEARLLYIEKGIAIKAAKDAQATSFCFNNGRRIVERDSVPKDVITYIRNGDLYVSYPARGRSFEGYNERSAGDNIATGYEVQVDTGSLYTPSISIATKYNASGDQGVMIAYFKKDSGVFGRIHIAYQHHPDSAWETVAYQGRRFADLAGDGSDVTPVLTPITQNSWVIAASYMGSPVGLQGVPGILGFRMVVNGSGHLQVVDVTPSYLYSDLITDTGTFRSTFPTIASRPIADSLYPVRLAWQKNGQIYYRRFTWQHPVTLTLETEKIISKGLPSYCYNYHPNIAVGGYAERFYKQNLTPTALTFSIPYISDNVVWESKLFKPSSNGEYWAVLRSSSQLLGAIPVNWGQFIVMRPDTDATGFRYPIVTSEHKTHDIYKKRIYDIPRPDKPYVMEGLRVAWQDENLGKLEFGHLLRYFYKSELQDPGLLPSLPLSTNELMASFEDPLILKSVTYLDTTNMSSRHNVQVTNGWFPYVANTKKIQDHWSFVIYKDPVLFAQCLDIAIKDGKGPQIKQYIPSNDSTIMIDWVPPPPGDYGDFGEQWNVPDTKPYAVSTENFVAHPNDSIIVPRWIDTIDVTGVQSILLNSTDYLIYRIQMLRSSDSSYIMTLDSGVVTKTSVLMPGSGLDPYAARVKLSSGFSSDTVFLVHQFLRTNSGNILGRAYMADCVDSNTDAAAYKRGTDDPQPVSANHSLVNMEIFPNPLSLTARIEATTPEGIVLIELYDINGKKIQTLFNGVSNGKLTLILDGKDLPNGIYFLRIQCGNTVATKKVELVK